MLDCARFYLVLAGAMDATLKIDEFVEGCMRMQGAATAIDMRKLLIDIQHMHTLQMKQHGSVKHLPWKKL